MNVIIEANIPYAKGVLEQSGVNVRYLPPEQITPDAMRNTDALITRTRTQCNSTLLAQSRCSMIATATIGTDHIDMEWCHSHGIKVANAPGCNAPAVAQYLFASLMTLFGPDLFGKKLGVVGVGHVGSIVAEWAHSLGMEILLCDPPRQRAEGNPDMFTDLESIARLCDVITFHVPYTKTGTDATHHMCNAEFLDKCMRRPVIVNSARGAVTDTEALIRWLESGKISDVVIDCWENEPRISSVLLEAAAIATPHIAGYSREGKIRATHAAIKAVAQHFGLPEPEFNEPTPAAPPHSVTPQQIMLSYSPATDTHTLKSAPGQFEYLRNHYNLRPEPFALNI